MVIPVPSLCHSLQSPSLDVPTNMAATARLPGQVLCDEPAVLVGGDPCSPLQNVLETRFNTLAMVLKECVHTRLEIILIPCGGEFPGEKVLNQIGRDAPVFAALPEEPDEEGVKDTEAQIEILRRLIHSMVLPQLAEM